MVLNHLFFCTFFETFMYFLCTFWNFINFWKRCYYWFWCHCNDNEYSISYCKKTYNWSYYIKLTHFVRYACFHSLRSFKLFKFIIKIYIVSVSEQPKKLKAFEGLSYKFIKHFYEHKQLMLKVSTRNRKIIQHILALLILPL